MNSVEQHLSEGRKSKSKWASRICSQKITLDNLPEQHKQEQQSANHIEIKSQQTR